MEELRVRWHGHSCFEIATDDLTIVTDPHDGKSLGIKPPKVRADVVLVSHDHFDHAAVRTVDKAGTARVVTGTETITMGGLVIRGVQTYHDQYEGESRGGNIAFVFDMEGVTFCHLGDLGHMLTPEQVGSIGPVDVLFLPVGGVFTIDAESAWKVVDQLRPGIVVPMHYRVGGLSLSINDIKPFLDRADPDCVMKVGNEVVFSNADIEDEMLVWIFAL